MPAGTVKWFNEDRGYGFITPTEGGRDLYVHYTGIVANGFRTLSQDDRVTYEAEDTPRGPKAVQVTPIS